MSVDKEYSFDLDLKNKGSYPRMEFVAQDKNASILLVTITDDGVPVDLTGYEAQLNVRKADGTLVTQSSQDELGGVFITSPANGLVRIVLLMQTIAAKGDNYADVSIINATDKVTTNEFKFYVRENKDNDQSVESTNYLSRFEQLEDDFIEAEATRQQTFTTNEANRQSTFDTNEAAREAEFEVIVDQYEAAISSQTSLEVIAARASAKLGVTYPNLDGRLEFIESEVFAGAELPLTLDPSNQVKSITDSTDGIADVEVGGATLYQAVVNEDFANGTTGWTADAGSLSVSSKIATLTGNNTYLQSYMTNVTAEDAMPNIKVFLKARLRVTNAVCQQIAIGLGATVAGATQLLSRANPAQNTWFDDFYGIVTTPSDFSGKLRVRLYQTYIDAATANGKVMEVDGNVGVFAVNLTALGLDSLTADQCNYMINKYFEGFAGSNEFTLESAAANVFKPTVGSAAVSGVTVTVDEGGYIALNGTATATKYVKITNGLVGLTGATDPVLTNQNYPLKKVTYSIGYKDVTGTSSGDIYRPWIGVMYKDGTFTLGSDYPATQSKNNIIAKDVAGVALYFTNGNVFNNFRFRIALNEGSVSKNDTYKGRKLTVKGFTRHKLPNGVQDWFMQKRGYTWATRNIFSGSDGKGYALQSADITAIDTSQPTCDWVRINKRTDDIMYNNATTNLASSQAKNVEGFVPGTFYTNGVVGTHINYSTTQFMVAVAKGTYADVAAARTDLVTNKQTKILYQLATPQYIPFEDFGANGIEVDGIVTTHNDYTHLALTSADVTPTINMTYQGTIQGAVIALKEAVANDVELLQLHEKIIDKLISGELAAGKASKLDDKTKDDFMNSIAIGSSSDPNTTTESYIVTNHTNGPNIDSRYWHILTLFYSSKASNKGQIAITYNGTEVDEMYIRYYHTVSGWSTWTQLFNQKNYGKVQSKSASFTLAMADKNTFTSMTGSTTQTITVPTNATVAFPIGTQIVFEMAGTGAVTFAAAGGVTIRSKDSKKTIDGQYSGVTLTKVGTDTWSLIGALKV